jgi:hypothetical protein
MGVRWMDLSAATREVLEQGVKKTALEGGAKEVAGVTYGLGMMECTWEGLPLDLRRSIAGGILRICGAHERIRDEFNHVDNLDETRPMADSGIGHYSYSVILSIVFSFSQQYVVDAFHIISLLLPFKLSLSMRF